MRYCINVSSSTISKLLLYFQTVIEKLNSSLFAGFESISNFVAKSSQYLWNELIVESLSSPRFTIVILQIIIIPYYKESKSIYKKRLSCWFENTSCIISNLSQSRKNFLWNLKKWSFIKEEPGDHKKFSINTSNPRLGT